MGILLWLLWFGLVVVSVVVVFRRYNSPLHRRLDLPSEAPSSRFIGGMRWGGGSTFGIGNATAPLVRLDLFDWGIRLGPSVSLLRSIVPTWEVRYSELQGAELVQGPVFASKAIRFRSIDAGGPMVFWTSTGLQILSLLAEHGVAVDRSLSKLGWTSNE